MTRYSHHGEPSRRPDLMWVEEAIDAIVGIAKTIFKEFAVGIQNAFARKRDR